MVAGDLSNTGELSDTMVDMDNVGSRHQLRQKGFTPFCNFAERASAFCIAKDLGVSENKQRTG